MDWGLFLAVTLVAFANGANDNFKGVATLWGANRTRYGRALGWATAFTFLGSLVAIWVARGLVAKFNGSQLVGGDIASQTSFLAAVAAGAGVTVLLAAWLGLPISTTHALTGALVGAGVSAAGAGNVAFSALGAGVVLPLLLSPLVALGLTWGIFRAWQSTGGGSPARDCVCVDEPQAAAVAAPGTSFAAMVLAPPAIRVANSAECKTGQEAVKLDAGNALHWLSAAGISFARGLNDTPKIAALLLAAGVAGAAQMNYAVVAVAMAVGGVLGAARVARTMSRQITPMATGEAVAANLVAASLVTAASFWALPVSTTHVTSGGIFGIGLLRRKEADWRRVRDIVLSWAGTLPMGAAVAAVIYIFMA